MFILYEEHVLMHLLHLQILDDRFCRLYWNIAFLKKKKNSLSLSLSLSCTFSLLLLRYFSTAHAGTICIHSLSFQPWDS